MGKSFWARILPGCFCGSPTKDENDEVAQDARGRDTGVEAPSSPPALMEPVLSMACHGTVKGQERNVFVAVKNYLLNSNVKVTQLARPCDVLMVFHDITGGVNMDDLLRKVGNAAGESGALKVVLVLMYMDFSGNELAGFQASGRQRLGEKSWRRLENTVSLVVDMVYNEEDNALLDCLQNSYSLQQVVQYLKHVVRNQNAMLTGDSFTITRAVQHSTPPKNGAQNSKPQGTPEPQSLIRAGPVHHKARTPSSSTASSSQGSFHHAPSPHASPKAPWSPHRAGPRTKPPPLPAPPLAPERSMQQPPVQRTTPKRPKSRRPKSKTKKRNNTWGGGDEAPPVHSSSRGMQSRSSRKVLRPKQQQQDYMPATADGYASHVADKIASACFQSEKCIRSGGVAWQPTSPPVFDGNCFLELTPQ